MFNTIQYRDGKIIAAAIDEITGSISPKPTVSSGSSPSTQVFNPHAGVQISSPSHAFFDDELPPVEEPFLPE